MLLKDYLNTVIDTIKNVSSSEDIFVGVINQNLWILLKKMLRKVQNQCANLLI